MIKPIILVPDYKIDKSSSEIRNINNLYKKLEGNIELVYILPEKYKSQFSLRAVYFPDKYFDNIITYSQLMYSSFFWREFKDYTHALIHQPDCFVFGDPIELLFWCKLNYSFIGAPHFKNYNFVENPFELQNTMNGGFSLRNIQDHISILDYYEGKGFVPEQCQGHEDTILVEMFRRAKFRLPDPLTCARFAWEQGATRLYSLCNWELPFGSHAPDKYMEFYPDEISAIINP